MAQQRGRGVKLTSFDKLIGRKGEGVRRVRIYPEVESVSGLDSLDEESAEAL